MIEYDYFMFVSNWVSRNRCKFDNRNIDSILFIHNDIILKVLRYDM